jgi:hypothetical protein
MLNLANCIGVSVYLWSENEKNHFLQTNVHKTPSEKKCSQLLVCKGGDYKLAEWICIYLIFRMVFFFLILRYIKKMATDRGGGVVDGRARRFQARILVPGWNPNRMQIFLFTNFCIQSD